MTTAIETPWPTDIEVKKADRTLTVTFEDGKVFTFTAEFLRVNSPSAEVQGHSPDQRQTVPGKINVGFVDFEDVGNYAVKIIFDDGHDSGLYTWAEFYRLGLEQDALWDQYLRELADQGLSRRPTA